jgi:outer membrane protein assembly factor BamB
MNMIKSCAGTAVLLILTCYPASPQTAQFRGQHRDGHFDETGLMNSWPEKGPELLFSLKGMGNGFSEPVASNSTIYVTGKKDTMDYLSAVGMDGSLKWSVPFGRSWTRSYQDTRTIPTVTGDRAYVISGSGVVTCLDAGTGDIIWSVNGFEKFEGICSEWGVAESPLLVDDKVIYTPAGSKTTMVALDRNTGETVWMSESLGDSTAYVSPILAEYAGRKMIIGVLSNHIYGVDASDGTILWKYRYYDLETPLWDPWAPIINCISPLFHGNRVYATSGYDHVGVMLEFNEDGTQVGFVWSDTTLDCHHGGVVDGYIYGANWINNGFGRWCCIDWETGKTMYVREWETKGSTITDGKHLYCYDERRGNVALVPVTPDDFNIVSTFRIRQGNGPHWAHLSIHDGRLLIRHGDVLMVYDIREKGLSFNE